MFGRIRSGSAGRTPPHHKSRAVGSGVFMRQLDLTAPGANASQSGTPSLWPEQKPRLLHTGTAEQLSICKSAVLVAKDCAQRDAAAVTIDRDAAAQQGSHDIALNPFSMFCASQVGSDAGASAVPSPVKAKLRRNLFGPG